MKTFIPDHWIKKPEGYPENLSADEINRRFRTLLGEFETPSVSLNLRVEDEVELPGGVVRQRVVYNTDADEQVPALHLYLKNLPKNAPGLLSIHAHGGDDIFPVGKEFHCHPYKEDPTQYSYIAALSGFRVLAPDALCFGERRTAWGYSTNFFDEIAVHAELTGTGKSLAWKSVWDNSRAIEALEALGCTAIGAIGWSGGSTQAYILASVNPKIKAAACFFSFATLRHQFYQYRLCHCLYHYIPGMVKNGLDWDQVVALVPPRKLFFGWGALDEGSPEPMYRAFCDAVKKKNEKSLVVFEEKEKGHEITAPMLDAAIQFLGENV